MNEISQLIPVTYKILDIMSVQGAKQLLYLWESFSLTNPVLLVDNFIIYMYNPPTTFLD